MKRAIIVVIDSLGIGAMPDCAEFGDDFSINTICNTAHAAGGLNVPNLEKMGLGNLAEIEGVKKVQNQTAQTGIMLAKAKGKDTTTGHWEIAGLCLDEPFRTYINFPNELIENFIKETKCGGILGNCPASGTKIIEELNEEHQKTKFPIVYTSADSVFQIAADIDLIGLDTLYKWCEVARRLLDNGYGVSRVIARPYHIVDGKPQRIGSMRHDYSVLPPKDTLLDYIQKQGGKTLAIGKIKDIFCGKGVDEHVKTGGNTEGLKETLSAIKTAQDFNLIFTNLVDTDMLYGHRRDYTGYARAIEEIDSYLPEFIKEMSNDDILIITADHGCDPTFKGTDHTREKVPVLIYGKTLEPKDLGIKESFSFVSDTVKNWLNI